MSELATNDRSLLRRATGRLRAAVRATGHVPAAAVRVMRNVGRRMTRSADRDRWSSPGGLEAWWSQRTRQMASHIPAESTVIEFGAGTCQLRSMLPPSCRYIPSDLVDRGPGTIVFDLNARPLFALAPHRADVAVFAGVLEYVSDVRSLLDWLAANGISRCVASYDCLAERRGPWRRIRDWSDRTYHGYMSNFTESGLKACFRSAGFNCTASESWTRQRIFVFERADSVRTPSASARAHHESTVVQTPIAVEVMSS